MSKERNSHDNRNLSEVFQELKAMQNPNYYSGQVVNLSQKPAKKTGSSSRTKEQVNNPNDLKISHIVIGSSILILGMSIVFPMNLSYKTSYAHEETISNVSEYVQSHLLSIHYPNIYIFLLLEYHMYNHLAMFVISRIRWVSDALSYRFV